MLVDIHTWFRWFNKKSVYLKIPIKLLTHLSKVDALPNTNRVGSALVGFMALPARVSKWDFWSNTVWLFYLDSQTRRAHKWSKDWLDQIMQQKCHCQASSVNGRGSFFIPSIRISFQVHRARRWWRRRRWRELFQVKKQCLHHFQVSGRCLQNHGWSVQWYK